MAKRLGTVPLIRRLEYLDIFLEGLDQGLTSQGLEDSLSERKRLFEEEKDLALGKSQLRRRALVKARYLNRYCSRLTRALGFVKPSGNRLSLTPLGRRYADGSGVERARILAEAYSVAYPHLGVVVSALSHSQGFKATLLLDDSEGFRGEANVLGFDMSLMVFTVVRDTAVALGLFNWRMEVESRSRRQTMYLCCDLSRETPFSYLVRIKTKEGWLYALERPVDRGVMRDVLWREYLALAEGVPGSPVFWTVVRDRVCESLRIRDDQFDAEIMRMSEESDDELRVVWSEGNPAFQLEYTSTLKSLPPKNEWGNYMLYLKVARI